MVCGKLVSALEPVLSPCSIKRMEGMGSSVLGQKLQIKLALMLAADLLVLP